MTTKKLKHRVKACLKRGSMVGSTKEKASHGNMDHSLGNIASLLAIAQGLPPSPHSAEVPL